jgi:hypothetical protein
MVLAWGLKDTGRRAFSSCSAVALALGFALVGCDSGTPAQPVDGPDQDGGNTLPDAPNDARHVLDAEVQEGAGVDVLADGGLHGDADCVPDCTARTCGWDPVCGSQICGSGCPSPTVCDTLAGCCISRSNLLVNGDFESGSGSTPDGWLVESARVPDPLYQWDNGADCHNGRCVSIAIDTSAPNDGRWIQALRLTPTAPLNLTGWIKGSNIVAQTPDMTLGANVCENGTWTHSDAPMGTFGYKQVSVTFESDSTGEVTAGARLGFWNSVVAGRAWFDDLLLTSDDFSARSGDHITLVLEQDSLLTIPPKDIDRWLKHLDEAYVAYQDLVGSPPFSGEKIRILSVRQFPGGWAVAGQPVQWMKQYIGDQLRAVRLHDDWSFGIVHEIGHNFDLDYRWVWEAEMSANLKLYYVVSTLGGRVGQQGPGGDTFYDGAGLKNFYQWLHDKNGSALVWDSITYRFIVISETIGWDPFKKTYRYFNTLKPSELPDPNSSTARLDRFQLFVQKLTDFSGTDVRGLFALGELDWVTTQLSTN